MSESPTPESQQLPNLELYVEYIKSHNRKADEEKIKLAKKIFLETYSENITDGMTSWAAADLGKGLEAFAKVGKKLGVIQ